MKKKNYNIANLQLLITFGILVLLMVVLAIYSENYLSVTNIFNILKQRACLIICCCAMNFVLISGGIDLSVGAVYAFVSCVVAKLAVEGIPLPVAMIIGIVAGAACGSLSGLLITFCKLPPFISTLSVSYLAQGTGYVISNSAPIFSGLPANYGWVNGFLLGVPYIIWIAAVIFIIFLIIQRTTVFGKHIFAIGGNPETARLSGINVKKATIAVYVISGILAAIAGILQSSRISSGDPNLVTSGLEFQAIVSNVLGGVSLSGGQGSLIGALIGALILGNLYNGMNLLGFGTVYQFIIQGFVLIVAVIVDLSLKGIGIDFKGIKVSMSKKSKRKSEKNSN